MKTTQMQRFVPRTIRRRQILNAKYNPRKIKAANRARLRKSLAEHGLVTTLVWNKRTGNLVGGHRRLDEIDAVEGTDDYALTVAVIDVDPLREKALNLILNNPAAQGEYDDKLLSKLLQELAGKIDKELTGFDENEVERMLAETILPDAQYPITAKQHERYDFVVEFTENESDFAFLQTLCGVQTERSYKKTGIGIGRAVPFIRFLKSIRENRHSIDVQGGNDDDASAHPERRRVRPGKPTR
jgi:hypothetical protein